MLSGAMDIITIQTPEGKFKSSSFHVRFGSLKVIKSYEKIIEIYVNGNKTGVTMTLSHSGDAYFIYDEEDPYMKEKSNKKFEQYEEEEIKYYDNISNFTSNNITNNNISNNNISNFNISNNNITHNDSKFKFLISNCQKEIINENNENKRKEIFVENMIPKEKYFNDPWSILNNKNIVFYYNGRLYNFQAAAPIIFSIMLYKDPLPDEKIQELISTTSFFGKNDIINISKITIPNFDEEKTINNLAKKKSQSKLKNYKKKYRSFFPSSNQLKKLNLNQGKNEITFVCRGSISGTHTLTCYIYLWSSLSKIVISDIDGTITKSDVLGQVLPIIGKDWSHNGITDLFTNIANNGYKILYLTARAICQSELTRDYLETLFQEKQGLPPGPIIMSPDGLFSSFKREVIDKNPQILKITTLTEIRTLFPKKVCPFYAGFGNRENDAVAYRSVGIDMGKIFIINTKGDLMQLNNSEIISYGKLNEKVNEIFPNIRNK